MQYFKLLIFLCILSACKNKQYTPSIDKDLQAVIAICIIKTTGKGDTARYFYKLRPFMPGYDKPEELKKENDSIKFGLDTAVVYLLVDDSLGHVYNDDKVALQSFIKTYNYTIGNDSVGIIKQDSSANQTIDITELEKDIQFPIKTKEQGINDKLRITGRFFFSRPAFNKLKTIAAIHLNFFITRHIGYGEIFLLEKIDHRWKVIKRERTWVS